MRIQVLNGDIRFEEATLLAIDKLYDLGVVQRGLTQALTEKLESALAEYLYNFGFLVWFCRVLDVYRYFAADLSASNTKGLRVVQPRGGEIAAAVLEHAESLGDLSRDCFALHREHWQKFLENNSEHVRDLISGFVGLAKAYIEGVVFAYDATSDLQLSFAIVRSVQSLLPASQNTVLPLGLHKYHSDLLLKKREGIVSSILKSPPAELLTTPIDYLKSIFDSVNGAWITDKALRKFMRKVVSPKVELRKLLSIGFNVSCPLQSMHRESGEKLYRFARVYSALPDELLAVAHDRSRTAIGLDRNIFDKDVTLQKVSREVRAFFSSCFATLDCVDQERIVSHLELGHEDWDQSQCKRVVSHLLEAVDTEHFAAPLAFNHEEYKNAWYNRSFSVLETKHNESMSMKLQKEIRRFFTSMALVLSTEQIVRRLLSQHLLSPPLSKMDLERRLLRMHGKFDGIGKRPVQFSERELFEINTKDLNLSAEAAACFAGDKKSTQALGLRKKQQNLVRESIEILYAKGALSCVRTQTGQGVLEVPYKRTEDWSEFQALQWRPCETSEGRPLVEQARDQVELTRGGVSESRSKDTLTFLHSLFKAISIRGSLSPMEYANFIDSAVPKKYRFELRSEANDVLEDCGVNRWTVPRAQMLMERIERMEVIPGNRRSPSQRRPEV